LRFVGDSLEADVRHPNLPAVQQHCSTEAVVESPHALSLNDDWQIVQAQSLYLQTSDFEADLCRHRTLSSPDNETPRNSRSGFIGHAIIVSCGFSCENSATSGFLSRASRRHARITPPDTSALLEKIRPGRGRPHSISAVTILLSARHRGNRPSRRPRAWEMLEMSKHSSTRGNRESCKRVAKRC